MKPCEYCGYSFEHKPETCRALLTERKAPVKKIHHVKAKRNLVGNVAISSENMVKFAEYLNGKRVK